MNASSLSEHTFGSYLKHVKNIRKQKLINKTNLKLLKITRPYNLECQMI